MSRSQAAAHERRILVTGGAGFIGGAMVERLVSDGATVTIFDDLSTAEPDWEAPLASHLRSGRVRFVRGDVADLDAVSAVMPGHDEVVHLAANTDIPGGFDDPSLDLRGCVLGTWNVAEAMRRHGVRHILFASSGVVYGTADHLPTAEDAGNLRPASHYAAAKLAGEQLLSGFAHLYGWRAFAFRFGNTIGPRSNHGVVHDFVVKLLRDPWRLEVLGDGTQAKPYIAVDDLVDGVLHAAIHAPEQPMTVLNVATPGTLDVLRVAELVAEATGTDRDGLDITCTGAVPGGGGWAGDTPRIDLDGTALARLGWSPRRDAEGAVRWAAAGIAARLVGTGAPLVTAIERRQPAAVAPR